MYFFKTTVLYTRGHSTTTQFVPLAASSDTLMLYFISSTLGFYLSARVVFQDPHDEQLPTPEGHTDSQ